MLMIPKSNPVRSQQLRDSARGQQCTLRFPGYCDCQPETTVLAHLPLGGSGMRLKGSDDHAVFAGETCHSILDGRKPARISAAEKWECCLRALAETREIQRRLGLISIKGDKAA
jgi:hypothetical protein